MKVGKYYQYGGNLFVKAIESVNRKYLVIVVKHNIKIDGLNYVVGYYNGHVSTGVCSHSVKNQTPEINSLNSNLTTMTIEDRRKQYVPVGFKYWVDNHALNKYIEINFYEVETDIWLRLEKKFMESNVCVS